MKIKHLFTQFFSPDDVEYDDSGLKVDADSVDEAMSKAEKMSTHSEAKAYNVIGLGDVE